MLTTNFPPHRVKRPRSPRDDQDNTSFVFDPTFLSTLPVPSPQSIDHNSSSASGASRRHKKLQKDGSGEVWPDDVEELFLKGLKDYLSSPWSKGCRGRNRWRNQYLVEYLRREGIVRSKKQVASHVQVLRNLWKHDPRFHLVARPDEQQQQQQQLAHTSSSATPTTTTTGTGTGKAVGANGQAVNGSGLGPTLFDTLDDAFRYDSLSSIGSSSANSLRSFPGFSAPFDFEPPSPASSLSLESGSPAFSPVNPTTPFNLPSPATSPHPVSQQLLVKREPFEVDERLSAAPSSSQARPRSHTSPVRQTRPSAAPQMHSPLPQMQPTIQPQPRSAPPISAPRPPTFSVATESPLPRARPAPHRVPSPPRPQPVVPVAGGVTGICLWSDGMDPFSIATDATSDAVTTLHLMLKVPLPASNGSSTAGPLASGIEAAVTTRGMPSKGTTCTTSVYHSQACISRETAPLQPVPEGGEKSKDRERVMSRLPDSWLSNCRWLRPDQDTTITQEVSDGSRPLLRIIYDVRRISAHESCSALQIR